MLRKEENGVHWLEFDLLKGQKGVRHGSFLRHGGHSTGPYDSLNLGPDSDIPDDPAVTSNLQIASEALGISNLVWLKQRHGDVVVDVTNHASPHTAEGDALITTEPGIGLLIKHADCQAGLLYDPIKHVAAAVHSGWRGSVKNIYAKVIDRLKAAYGCDPANILVGMSPSLGPCHAEFKNYQTELPEYFWEFQVKPTYFDFWAISEMQLRAAGILPQHIEMARICTYANAQDCFSYRRDKITGRHGTTIMLV